jgi:antitoxin component of MazEF toxin-antitoxin module
MRKELEYRRVYGMARGLSIGICLPRQYMRNLSITSWDLVKIHQEEDRIVIEKAQV